MFRLVISLAFHYLWGRKLRSFLTTLAILFGTLVIFATNLLLPTMIQAFQANVLAASGQVDATITHSSGGAFPVKILHKVKSVPGVRAAAGSLSRTINIPSGYFSQAEVGALTLTGIDPRPAQELRSYPVEVGRFIRPNDTTSAVITTSLADNLHLQLGDRLYIPTTEGRNSLTIVGLLPPRSAPRNEEVLISLYQAQRWIDQPDYINTIEANLDTTDEARREAILAHLQTILGDDYSLGAMSSGTELFASMKTGQAAFNLFGFLALFMGGFIIFNTFRTIVAERRHDIGMLRSIGANRSTIIGLILVEGFIQGVAGTLVGILLGYWIGSSLLGMMEPVFNQFMHLKIGPPVVEPGLVGTTILLGIGVTLLAGLLPAFGASRVTPLEALRRAPAESNPRTSLAVLLVGLLFIALAVFGLLSGVVGLTVLGGLLFLVGLVLVAPALVKPIAYLFGSILAITLARDGTGSLAQSNLNRQPSRAAITASATMIGLAIIVGMGGLVFSLTGGFLGILQRSLGSDYLLMPPSVGVWGSNVGAKGALAEKLRDVPGVETVSSMRFALANAEGRSVSLLGIDPQVYPRVASLTFQKGSPETAFSELDRQRALIANGVFAAQAKLKVGDVLRISTPTGVKQYTVAGVAGDYLNAKILTAYISQANLERDFKKNEDVFIQVNLQNGANPIKVEERMRKILEDYPQFKLVSGRAYFEENRQLFNAIVSGYFVLLAVLALPSLIAMLNTLAIGVIERTREIGMLRAIGAQRKQVSRIVITESLLLAAIGTALGLLAGLYLGYVMVLGLSVSGFPVEYSFPYYGLLAAIAAGLIFGVLAALLPARQAAHMEIVRALRYE